MGKAGALRPRRSQGTFTLGKTLAPAPLERRLRVRLRPADRRWHTLAARSLAGPWLVAQTRAQGPSPGRCGQ